MAKKRLNSLRTVNAFDALTSLFISKTNQLDKMGKKPFTQWLVTRRARRLSALYPKYHKTIIEDYSKTVGLF
jgi:hypothetical protein